ncbi:MAG TPA: class I SAM-dependent methyltransferase [Halothiobacillaceae bacterium]|nr:class I SAM-dependent methyltransferase [Halothiobacillaceae bacterium]
MAQQNQTTVGQAVAHWYQSPAGAQASADLARRLGQCAQTAFGYHALVLGSGAAGLDERIDWSSLLSVPLVATVDAVGASGGQSRSATVRAQMDALPFESESIDVVIAPHLLEARSNPHELLQEIDRVLRPEGRLFIVGVNPTSLLKIAALLGVPCHQDLRSGAHHPAWRVVDWLRLLGYQINAIEPIGGFWPGCRKPVKSGSGLQRLSADWAWFLHGCYLIDASRRVSRPHALKPEFRLSEWINRKTKPVAAPGARRVEKRCNRNE